MEIRRNVDEVANIDLDRFDKWQNKIGITRGVEEETVKAIDAIAGSIAGNYAHHEDGNGRGG